MDKYDLLEAMGGIRDRYIEDAGPASVPEPEQAEKLPASSSQKNKTFPGKTAGKKLRKFPRWSTAVAALVCVSILLPNLLPGITSVFRDVPLLDRYFSLVSFRKHDDQEMTAGSRSSDSGVYTMGAENPKELAESAAAEEETYDGDGEYVTSSPDYESTVNENLSDTERLAAESTETEEAGLDIPGMGNPNMSDKADESSSYYEETLSLQAVLSETDLSEDARDKAQTRILDFEKYVSDETGYESLRFVHEIAAETDKLLSISVTSCTEENDNYLQTNHFVFDKSTGSSLSLRSLFGKDVDYITPLSDNIKEQMRKEMEEDSYVQYRLDSAENPETDFKSIRPDQDYYIDGDGNLVICFDVEEVAPLYMGAAEFIIPPEITDPLMSK